VNDLALGLRQARFENKAFWRNPASAFFTFAFPLMFLFIFTTIFGSDTSTTPAGEEVSNSTYYVPAILAFSVINACYTNIAIGTAFARDQGILKRVRGTPLPAWSYLFGRVVHAIVVMLVLVAIVAAFGVLAYDIELPTGTLLPFFVTLMVGAAAFCGLGLAVTSSIPNAEASPAIVNASILPLLFISGVFIPIDDAPSWLKRIADVFPIKHFADAIFASFLGSGSGWRGTDLLIVAAWGVAGLLLALKFFTWEPRR
jgi:ABC-2 type transport system permease protein